MIKVRGWQVSPAELEAAILLHPGVADAAVVGMVSTADSTTEVPRAYVVRNAGSDTSETEIKQFMSTRLAKYKSLEGGVAFVDRIPRTPAGKVLRNVLKGRAQAETDADGKDGSTSLLTIEEAAKREQDRRLSDTVSSVTSGEGAHDTEWSLASSQTSPSVRAVTQDRTFSISNPTDTESSSDGKYELASADADHVGLGIEIGEKPLDRGTTANKSAAPESESAKRTRGQMSNQSSPTKKSRTRAGTVNGQTGSQT